MALFVYEISKEETEKHSLDIISQIVTVHGVACFLERLGGNP